MQNLSARIVARYITALAATKLQLGKTIENGTVRLHRYRDHIVAWDLTNSGKRGKKVERMSIIPSSSYWGDFGVGAADEFLERLAARLEDYESFGKVIGSVNDFLADYPNSITMHPYTERGVDVMPAGFQEVVIKTDHLLVEVGYKEFRVKDLDDTNNEPTCIPSSKGGIREIPVFYRWVKDNEASIRQMKYHNVLTEMRKMGIRYHDYCAMD